MRPQGGQQGPATEGVEHLAQRNPGLGPKSSREPVQQGEDLSGVHSAHALQSDWSQWVGAGQVGASRPPDLHSGHTETGPKELTAGGWCVSWHRPWRSLGPALGLRYL